MRPETLRSWHSLGLLGIMALAAIGPTAGTAEGISARRARIEQMSAAEKQLLREKKDRFDQLTEHEQEKLRLIHNQLEGDPDSEHLTRVMENYFEWLKTLSPGQRAELLELGVDERIARVKFFHQEQQSQYFRRLIVTKLPAADGRVMFSWLNAYFEHHADELVALLPPKKRGRYQALTRPVDKRRFIVQSLHQGHLLQQLPKPSVQEIEKLVASLSPEARAAVAKLDNPQARTELVQKWLRSAVTARMNQNRAFRLAPAVDTRVLDKFFDEKLSPAQRGRLEGLPRNQLYVELRRLYSLRNRKTASGAAHSRNQPTTRALQPRTLKRTDQPARDR